MKLLPFSNGQSLLQDAVFPEMCFPLSSTLVEHHGNLWSLHGGSCIVQALCVIPRNVKGKIQLQPSSTGHISPQFPELPRMYTPLSSTLVAHQGTLTGENSCVQALNVFAGCGCLIANLNGKMHFLPGVEPTPDVVKHSSAIITNMCILSFED